MPLIVAIDGPAGVGKSTTSRRVAEALDIPHIDTGAMYRAIALKSIRSGDPSKDDDDLARVAETAELTFRRVDGSLRVHLDGEDVSQQIRTPEVSLAASRVSAVPAVRRVLVRLQQELGRREGGVLEGRDIGTRVFPETPHKFFLTARPEVRAERRHAELAARGVEADLATVRTEMETRDRQDSTRVDSPLTYDESYVVIDTSDMTIDQVVDAIVGHVRSRL